MKRFIPFVVVAVVALLATGFLVLQRSIDFSTFKGAGLRRAVVDGIEEVIEEVREEVSR